LVVVWRYDSPANSRHELLLIIPICYNMHFTGEPRDNQSVLDHSVPGDLSLSHSRHCPHWEPPQVEPRSCPPTSSPPIDLSNQCTFFCIFFLGANKEILIAGNEGKQPPGQDQRTSPKGTGGSYTYVLLFWRKSRNGREVMNKVDSFSISQKSIFKTGSWQEVNNCDLNFFCDIPFGCRQSSVQTKVCMTYMECIPVYPMCVDEIQAMQGFKNSVIWYYFSSHSYWLHISHNLLTVAWMRRWMPTIPLTEPNFQALTLLQIDKDEGGPLGLEIITLSHVHYMLFVCCWSIVCFQI
jgi:hypothetical protein